MHLFLKKIYRKNPFPKIYRINQCEVLIAILGFFFFNKTQSKLNFSEEHTALLTAIDKELQLTEANKKDSRVLSDKLIGQISKLTNSLFPIKQEDSSILIGRDLSPERGILLAMLIEKKLSVATYQKIFSISTFDHAFLDKTDLSNTSLDRILLANAFFRNVNLSGASLVNANLFNVHFQNVNLREANLQKTNLREANLDGSNLTKANLTSAYLREANLKGVQIEDAILDEANLVGVNMNQTAKGLGNNN